MKKVISIMFVAVLLFGAVTCGGSSNAGEAEVAKMLNRHTVAYTAFIAKVVKAADAKEIAKLEIARIDLSTKLSKETISLKKKFPTTKGNSEAAIAAYKAYKAAVKATFKALEAGKKKFAATDTTK